MMTEKVRFSSTHGHNITLSNSSSTASWSAKGSSSWAFSATPLEQGQTVVVQLDGSGHCDLGYIKEDPASVNVSKPPLTFKHLNEIRIHKRTCTIPVSLNDKGTEVSSRFLDKLFNRGIDSGTTVWLAVYIKFGRISSKLLLNGSQNSPIKFSDNHGVNIALEENKFLASTMLANPASTCFIKEKMAVGEEFVFQCMPLLEGDHEPSRYHVKLQVYERNPECLKKDFMFLFDSTKPFLGDPPVTTLEVLEKEDCKGQVVIALINDTCVGYRAATSKYNEQRLNVKASEGIWVIFELFRTTVSVSKRVKPTAGSRGNVIDSVLREPSNVRAENSLVPTTSLRSVTALKRQYSAYTVVSDARSPDDNDVRERLSNLERSVEVLTETVQTSALVASGVSPAGSSNKPSGTATNASVSQLREKNSNAQDRPINFRPNFTQLIRDLHCDPLCDKLYERELVTSPEYHEIRAEGNSIDKNRKMLLVMNKKNINKSQMDQILDDTEQGHLKPLF